MYMNCLAFVDTFHRDNGASLDRDNWRRSSFQVTSCYVLCYTICYRRCNSICFKNAKLFVNIFLKVRHILFGVCGIVFAYVTDEIAPGVFLTRLVGINRGLRRKNTQFDQWFVIYVKNLFALTNFLVTLIEGKLIIELFL